MVVVDDVYNGWRHWVLPVACSNEMVMDAVLAVSAFHLSGKTPRPCLANPATFYAQAIKQLQDRRDLVHWDLQTKQLVILAIVVLLVAVMVNGCSDFPILFQMLQSALDAVGGEIELNDGGAMANFLLRQIHK